MSTRRDRLAMVVALYLTGCTGGSGASSGTAGTGGGAGSAGASGPTGGGGAGGTTGTGGGAGASGASGGGGAAGASGTAGGGGTTGAGGAGGSTGAGGAGGSTGAGGAGGSTGAGGAAGSTGAGGAAGSTGAGGAGGSTGAGGAAGSTGAGGAAGASGTAGGGGASPQVYPAFAPDLPTVTSGGGGTLANPTVIPIFFADEDPARVAAVTDFLSKLSGSAYWTATTSEYGVGSISVAPVVKLVETAPTTTDHDTIASWLVTSIAGNEIPAPTPEGIYTIYFPESTTINSGTMQSCANFGGYHDEVMSAGGPIVYAVIAGCASYGARLAPGETIQGIDFSTGITTHELIEASTDPFVEASPAYDAIDPVHLAWSRYLNGEELADTCEMQPGAFFLETTLGYTVQRSWSDVAAKQGHNPCPPRGGPFFEATPNLPPVLARGMTAEAIQAGLGDTVTIEIDLASDGPTAGPWTVTAIDYASEHGSAPELALSLDKAAGSNGDKLALTIEVLVADAAGFEGFILESSLGGQKFRSAGLVFQP